MNTYSIFRKYKGKVIIYIILQFIKTGLVLLSPYCYLLFLNEVLTARRFEKLGVIVLLYAVIYMGKALISVLTKKVYNQIFPMLKMEYKNCILEKYNSLDMVMLQTYTSGELHTCLHRDTENVVLYWEKKVEMLTASIRILITTGILLYLNWALALISFLLLPLSFWVTRYIKGKSNVEFEKERRILGTYNDFMIHNMFFWKEVKTNCLENMQQKQFEKIWQEKGNAFLKSHMCWFLNRSFLAFKDVFLTKMGLYLAGGILAIQGMGTIPVLLTFMEYYADFADRLLEVADIFMKRGEQEQALKRVDAVMNLSREPHMHQLEIFEKLEFQNVDFSYTSGSEAVLQDFGMEIKKGESLAIVGESGCGKSTLIKMMAGLLLPDSGRILWNGNPMDEIDRSSIYKKVGFLMQESSLFNLSIRENLLLGNINASESEIEEACKKANIMEFIQSLPNTFDTLIGENGIRLSGGQKQRLMIARIFLQNPEVIVFDEATSALDYQNENEILNLLLDNIQEKTFIMVTHRGTSVARCDRVISM